jgi:hypothetical protein
VIAAAGKDSGSGHRQRNGNSDGESVVQLVHDDRPVRIGSLCKALHSDPDQPVGIQESSPSAKPNLCEIERHEAAVRNLRLYSSGPKHHDGAGSWDLANGTAKNTS